MKKVIVKKEEIKEVKEIKGILTLLYKNQYRNDYLTSEGVAYLSGLVDCEANLVFISRESLQAHVDKAVDIMKENLEDRDEDGEDSSYITDIKSASYIKGFNAAKKQFKSWYNFWS